MSKFINTELLKQIEKHEGRRNKIYFDSKGIPTIGIGHNLNEPFADHVIDYIFVEDLQNVIKDIRAKQSWILYYNMSQRRRNALIDLVFNLGITKYGKFKKHIKYAKDKQWENAAGEILWNTDNTGKRTKTKYYIDVKSRAVDIAKAIAEG